MEYPKKLNTPLPASDGYTHYMSGAARLMALLESGLGSCFEAQDLRKEMDKLLAEMRSGERTLADRVQVLLSHPASNFSSNMLDKVKLVPVQGCLYDTEWYDPRTEGNCGELIGFFQRSLNNTCVYPLPMGKQKTIAETNVNQSSMLNYPRCFMVHGFNVFLEEGLHEYDRNEIINNGVFSFIFSGVRELFCRPLSTFPRCKFEEFPRVVNQEAVVLPMMPFGVELSKKRMGVLIRPGEAFNVQIRFPQKPRTSKPVRITVVLEGMSHEPHGDYFDKGVVHFLDEQ